MFRKAKNIAVSGGTFTVTEVHAHEGLNGRQILSQSPYVVHGAIHDSGQRYPPSECHPGTREDILKIALDWVNKPLDEDESQIFWLSGPAGVGKTAIAQSLCQPLKELGRLGGDFFISRSVAGHSDRHTLFPTLAYQLAEMYPEFGHELDAIIKTNASILTKNIELQLQRLIINPLQQMNNKLDTPLVLIIDGLDEAGGEKDQTSLLQLLGSSFLGHHLPLKIILTSRPEPWTKSIFGDNPLRRSSLRYFLHRTSQTDKDIRTLLESKFAKIQKSHDLMKSRSDRWPCSEVVSDIVDRASGQFIYASTILRYIEDPNGNPTERLQAILKTTSTADSPYLALDDLYKHVLSKSSTIDHKLIILGTAISFAVTPILGMRRKSSAQNLLSSFSHGRRDIVDNKSTSVDNNATETKYFPIDHIERLLDFRVGDGFLAIRAIQSLVYISSDEKSQGGINFYHKSLQDFLLDPNRSGKYFVDMNQVYSKLTLGAFRLIKEREQSSITSNEEESYSDLKIIGPRWVKWYLRSAAFDQDRLLAEIKTIDEKAFYLNYTLYIIQKAPLLLIKHYPRQIRRWVKSHQSGGNIAESISRISRRRTGALSLSLERFQAVYTTFEPLIRRVN